MRRILQISTATLAGIALLLLLWKVLVTGHVESKAAQAPALEELADYTLDPAVAMAEIPELRQARGSVLGGTSLAAAEEPAEFVTAVAGFTGEPAPIAPAPGDDLVVALRRMSQELDERAHRCEVRSRYDDADKLRRLADHVRRVAREAESAAVAPRGTLPPATPASD